MFRPFGRLINTTCNPALRAYFIAGTQSVSPVDKMIRSTRLNNPRGGVGLALMPLLWWYGGMAKRETITTNVRIPPDLHRRILAASRAAERSINAEVIMRLEASFALESMETRAAWEADQREKFNNAADTWQDMIAERQREFEALLAAQQERIAALEKSAHRIGPPAEQGKRRRAG